MPLFFGRYDWISLGVSDDRVDFIPKLTADPCIQTRSVTLRVSMLREIQRQALPWMLVCMSLMHISRVSCMASSVVETIESADVSHSALTSTIVLELRLQVTFS